MGFVTYVVQPGILRRPTARFMPHGRVQFNAAAARILESETHLLLVFDADEGRVGFQGTSADDPRGVRISHSQSQAVVHTKDFARSLGIEDGDLVELDRNLGFLSGLFRTPAPD